MINKKVTSVFAYLGLVYWFIAYVAGDREAAKFHLNQGLVMEIGFLILSIATAIPPITFVAPVAMIVFFVFKIIAIVGAFKGNEKSVPIFGNYKVLN